MRPRVAPRVAVCQRKASSPPPVQPDDHQPQPKVVPFQPRPVLSLRFRETNPRRLITNADQIITDANGSAFLGLQVNRPNNIDQGSGDVLCWLQASRTSDLLQASLDILSAHVVDSRQDGNHCRLQSGVAAICRCRRPHRFADPRPSKLPVFLRSMDELLPPGTRDQEGTGFRTHGAS